MKKSITKIENFKSLNRATRFLQGLKKIFSKSVTPKFVIFLMMMGFCVSGYSQDMALEFSPLNKLGELPGYVDVYVQMNRCPGKEYNEVIVKIHNESNSDKTVTFYLDVLNNKTGNQFTEEFTIDTERGQWIETTCESADDLKIVLPDSYKPHEVSVYLRWDS